MAHARNTETRSSSAEMHREVASKPSQSLGKWIDNLLGDKKARERAAAKAVERRRFFTPLP